MSNINTTEAQKNAVTSNPLECIVSLFDVFPDFPLPEWCEKLSHGKYMEIGAQLCTRDGRTIGNAFVDSICWHEQMQCDVAICYTDAGSKHTFIEKELKNLFYPPFFIMKIDKARAKIIRD